MNGRGGEGLRHFLFAGGGALALALFGPFGCMGGTGTDTENGVQVTVLVVTPSGVPAANVELGILHPSARIDSAGENPFINSKTEHVTDNEGYARFYLKRAGIHVAEGRRGDSVLFIAPSDFQGVPGFVHVFAVEPPVRATGRVRLLSGYQVDSGQVFIRGTKVRALLNPDGSYDLGLLPPSAENLPVSVVFRASPTDSSTVPPACLREGRNGVTDGRLDLDAGEIFVDDVRRGNGCPD